MVFTSLRNPGGFTLTLRIVSEVGSMNGTSPDIPDDVYLHQVCPLRGYYQSWRQARDMRRERLIVGC